MGLKSYLEHTVPSHFACIRLSQETDKDEGNGFGYRVPSESDVDADAVSNPRPDDNIGHL